MDLFQNTCFKENNNIVVENLTVMTKSHSNDKRLEKTFSSYHMEQKTFMEASCIYNIHSEGNFLVAAAFKGL